MQVSMQHIKSSSNLDWGIVYAWVNMYDLVKHAWLTVYRTLILKTMRIMIGHETRSNMQENGARTLGTKQFATRTIATRGKMLLGSLLLIGCYYGASNKTELGKQSTLLECGKNLSKLAVN